MQDLSSLILNAYNICKSCEHFIPQGKTDRGKCKLNPRRLLMPVEDYRNHISDLNSKCFDNPPKWKGPEKPPSFLKEKSRSKKVKSVIGLATNFLKERDKWTKAGKPVRTLQRINQIFNEHCRKCPHFNEHDEVSGNCNICGCRLHTKSKFMNKIAWSTTRCPDDPPRWIEETASQNIEEKPTPSPKKKGGCGCRGTIIKKD